MCVRFCVLACAYSWNALCMCAQFCVYAWALLLAGGHGCTGWFVDKVTLTVGTRSTLYHYYVFLVKFILKDRPGRIQILGVSYRTVDGSRNNVQRNFRRTRCNVSGKFSYILDPKLRSAYNIVLLGWWSLEVGISYIGGTNIKPVQSSLGERDSNAVYWDYTCVCRTNGVRSFVPIKYPPWFPPEVHFQILYQMFSHLDPCSRYQLAFNQYFKSNTNIIHLLFKCVSPQGIFFILSSIFAWSMFTCVSSCGYETLTWIEWRLAWIECTWTTT